MLPPDEGYQAISLADRLESNHAIAITPDGMLHMAVSSEIHARLGLTGVNSPSSADRYNVSLDLRAASLQPGGDRYAQVLAKLRASIPPQAFIARLEAKGELKEIGLPSQALSPSYGTEAWMPLESVARTLPGLLLPPLSRETFEQLGVAPEPHGEPEPGPGGGDGDGGGDGVIDAMDDGGGGGGGLAAALRRSRSLPLTPAQEWRLQRAITGLHTWLGALACGQSHTLCNDLLPDEVMPLQLEDAPLPSLEEQERRLLGTMVSRMWKGILSQGQVLNVMKSTAALVARRQVPWAAVTVWGFADTPVAWRGLEHGSAWGGSGESSYTVVFLPGGDYCVYRPLGPQEVPLPKGQRQ
ncbi:hypothetical protein PLESTF_000330900 [Pleodorina starrii]|nr:hypothetical protein PLESTF_000330900 [Pleodorina starrii]